MGTSETELPIFTKDEFPELFALIEQADLEIESGLAEPWPAIIQTCSCKTPMGL